MFGGGKSDTQTVAGRQQAINTAYEKLVQAAEVSVIIYEQYTMFVHNV